MAALGVALFYFGGFLALSGFGLENCTGGFADKVVQGVVVSGFLYVVATILILLRPPGKLGWLLIAPIFAGIALQLWMVSEFFFAYRGGGTSLCAWQMGMPEFTHMDGSEGLFVGWGLGTGALAIVGIALAWKKWRRFAKQKAPELDPPLEGGSKNP